MGFLKQLFGGPAKRVDPLFGEITFQNKGGFWEGHVDFAGLQNVEILIDADVNGPNEKQGMYFREFRESYSALATHVAPYLSDGSADAEWTLVCLDLQSDNPFTGPVELTYESAAGDLRSIVVNGGLAKPEISVVG